MIRDPFAALTKESHAFSFVTNILYRYRRESFATANPSLVRARMSRDALATLRECKEWFEAILDDDQNNK